MNARLLVFGCLLVSGCAAWDDLLGRHPEALTRRWFTPIEIPGIGANEFTGYPVVSRSTVVSAVAGGFVGLDAETGALRWRAILGDTSILPDASLAAGDSTVCVADVNFIGCVVTATGRLLWRETGDSAIIGGFAAGGSSTFSYGRNGGIVQARSMVDGKTLWATRIPPAAEI